MGDKTPNAVCEECGGSYWVKPYRRDKTRFCSFECGGKHRARASLNVGPKPWAAATLAQHRHKSTSRFKPGNEPWNRGVKGIHLSPASEWQKGRQSEKRLPVGTETIRRDKHGNDRAFVKVAEPNRWKERAIVAWERFNGRALPKGKVVHHRDRNTLNDQPSNLQALTRAEHIEVHRQDLLEAKQQRKAA